MAHAFWHLGGSQPQQSLVGPAYQPGFWEMLGRSQMDPRTVKILGDRQAELAEQGAALEAQRQRNQKARIDIASRQSITPEMQSLLRQDPTGRQGMVAKEYAPPKDDDDWFKKMMQLSFMQSMMPEREKYTGTSVVRGLGDTGASFYQWPTYDSPFPRGTV